MSAIAGEGLQLAFLALEPAAERIADPLGRRGAGHDLHQRAFVDRGLVRQQRHRVWQLAPALWLPHQRQHVDIVGMLADRVHHQVEIGLAGGGCKIAPP
jgi:hypothetical protein